MDNVSVVIRNKNEGEYIGFAIQSCLDFLDKPEIIIVDNGSTDDSLDTANLFVDRTDMKFLEIKEYTPGKAINLGAQTASRDITMVLSAHAQITALSKSDLETTNSFEGVFGKQTPIYKGKKISKRYIWSHFVDWSQENPHSNIEDRPFFHNAFSFFQTEVLMKYPMPEQYSGKEDRFWAADIISKGLQYLYLPSATCNHFYTRNGATWKGIG